MARAARSCGLCAAQQVSPKAREHCSVFPSPGSRVEMLPTLAGRTFVHVSLWHLS